MAAGRVLVVLDVSAAWSRGILKGFAAVAHERGWTLLHYHPSADIAWLAREWHPDATVLQPRRHGSVSAVLRDSVLVSVNEDASAEGIATVCLDEEKIAEIACAHLVSKGLTHVTTFRFDPSPFAEIRERRFSECAAELGARVVPGWWVDHAEPPRSYESPSGIAAWLKGLPKPCGVFACCDGWARIVARYSRVVGIRIPDELALVGADNDTFECELLAPPLTSVAIPWRKVGEKAAWLVQRALAGKPISGERIVIPPADIVPRRSSDSSAIHDPLVECAVHWIHEHAQHRMTVPSVARAVSTNRQRLERRFHAVLGRTVMQEVRRAHVAVAKRLLCTTTLDLARIARLSGFTTAALLSVAFRRETGMPPGAYRRRLQGLHLDDIE